MQSYLMLTFFIYIFIINVVAFHLYRIDKRKAERDEYRIPEAILLGVAFLGGGLGAFCAMREYHHKTFHTAFTVGVPIALILQLALVIWAIVRCLMAM